MLVKKQKIDKNYIGFEQMLFFLLVKCYFFLVELKKLRASAMFSPNYFAFPKLP